MAIAVARGPAVVYAIREISPDQGGQALRDTAAAAAARLAQEMSQRSMTAADAQRRLQSCLNWRNSPQRAGIYRQLHGL